MAMLGAERALAEVQPGFVVGLGSGRAASEFVRRLGDKVQAGFSIRGVPTSKATEGLARQCGISLVTLEEVPGVDLAVDGADEVDPELNLIKGLGGALVREKIVAASATRFIILVGREKLVKRLGERGTLPVEIVPFAVGPCQRAFDKLGLRSKLRRAEGVLPFRTDNGNYILDCATGPIAEPPALEMELLAVPGVVGTGLFLGMANAVIVDGGDAVRVLDRE